MIRTYILFWCSIVIISIILTGCNKIENSRTIDEAAKNRIKSLNLIDHGEIIHKFYSNYKSELAGNFFTNQRVAMYWIDEHDKTKISIQFAYYHDIKSIDTVCTAIQFNCPYMQVTRQNNTSFKVYVEGERREVKAFFEEAMQLWINKRQGNL